MTPSQLGSPRKIFLGTANHRQMYSLFTRAAIVTSYASRRFVHKAARFVPDPGKIAELRKGVAKAHELADRVRSENDEVQEVQEDRADEPQAEEADADSGDALDADSPYRIAAE